MNPNDSDRYAVFGNPIEHSKSPAIHSAFARQTGQTLEYTKVRVEPDGLAAAIDEFRAQGGKGLNITVPFKEQAYDLADQCSPRAQLAGAVNTLVLEEHGGLFGDNTDGPGLVRDLIHNLGITLKGKRLLLVGAGGAARGVMGPLLDSGPAELVIVNRTPARAQQLAERFQNYRTTPVHGGGFDLLPDRPFDLVINATAASLGGEAPPLPDAVLAGDAAAYDLMYASKPTPFMRWASRLTTGPVVDGLGMLVEQAAESFLLWRGLRPDTAEVIRALR